MIQTLFKDLLKEIIIWFKKLWFESKLNRIRTQSKTVADYITTDTEAKAFIDDWADCCQNFKPTFTEHKVDPKIQTGKSAKLGGALQLSAPWKKLKSK